MPASPPDPDQLTLTFTGGHYRTITGLAPGQGQHIIDRLTQGAVALVHAPNADTGPKHTWLFPGQLICIEAPMTDPDHYTPGTTA